MKLEKMNFCENSLVNLSSYKELYDETETTLNDFWIEHGELKPVAIGLRDGSYSKLRKFMPNDRDIIEFMYQDIFSNECTPEVIKMLDAHYEIFNSGSIDELNKSTDAINAKVKDYVKSTELDFDICEALSSNLNRFIRNQYLLILANELYKVSILEPFNPIKVLLELTPYGIEICRSLGVSPSEVERFDKPAIVQFNFNQMMYDLTPKIKKTLCDEIWISEHYWHAYHTNPEFMNYTTLVELFKYTHTNPF